MNLLQMTLSGGALILTVALLRALWLHRLPKWVLPVLWAVPLARLLIPVSIPFRFSVFTLLGRSLSGGGTAENPGTAVQPQPVQPVQIQPSQELPIQLPQAVEEPILNAVEGSGPSPWLVIWLAGAALCALVLLAAYLRCRREFGASLPVEDDRVSAWLAAHPLRRRVSVRRSDRIGAPLTYGLLRPVILLPREVAPEDLEYVLEHELVHIRRFDGLYKLLLNAAFCLHWFNPLVWLMVWLANRDLELSCDEAVVGRGENRSAYAHALVRMEAKKNGLFLYNHFSKTAIEARIKALVRSKKHSAALLTLVVVLVAAAAIFCATTATAAQPGGQNTEGEEEQWTEALTQQEIDWFNTAYFNTPEQRIRNMLLICDFSDPAQIDLYRLFYDGAQVGTTQVTAQEVEQLSAQYSDAASMDISKVTAGEMDGVLKQYLGLTLAETAQAGLEKFFYLPDYDAYYSIRGDTKYDFCTVTSGMRGEDGLVGLYYTLNGDPDDLHCVKLRQTEEGYLFLSNLPSDGVPEPEAGADEGQTSPAPLTFQPLPPDTETAPLKENSPLSPLELTKEVNVPALTAWALWDAGTEALVQGAENAAGKLWGDYTTEQRNDGLYLCPAAEADQSFISIANDGTLTYQASGEDAEATETPNKQTAVSLARALAAAFGLEERAWDDPYVETGGFDYDYKFTWSSGVNGLSLPGGGYLVICVRGNQAGSLRMSGQNLLPVRAWCYRVSDESSTELTQKARRAAESLWGSYTEEESGAGTGFRSEITVTPEGDYQERIWVSDPGRLFYQAGWLDAEETPFQRVQQPDRGAAVALARELAAAFGLEAVAAAEPVVEENARSADFVLRWPFGADSLTVEGYGLTVRVIGDQAVTLLWQQPGLTAVAEEAPDYFLSPEEALYCLNYARSLATPDSVFYATPRLASAALVWTTQFASPDYTPAYAFTLTNERETLFNTCYVDAFTGQVHTGTNEGGYPSPYQIGV